MAVDRSNPHFDRTERAWRQLLLSAAAVYGKIPGMLDMVIIGGGVHGTYLSHVISARLGFRELAVVDPYRQPLTVWGRHTQACGMRYLRSPSSHNLDLDFHALREFAVRRGWDRNTAFIPPYARPLLRLFDEHAAAVIRENGLQRWRHTGTVRDLILHDDHVTVTTEHQRLRARYALLAVGRSAALCYPRWSAALAAAGDVVDHVLAPTFCRQRLLHSDSPVIVGAGASGVQLALATAAESGTPVTVISEHEIRVRSFDSDPCFIGPRCARHFLAETDYSRRRAMIIAARDPGSVPEEVALQLSRFRDQGAVRIITAAVRSVRQTGGRIRLQLANGIDIQSDCVTVATGFAPGPPGGALVQQVAERYNLARSADGFPLPDGFLRWHPRLFVSGALAELELGPFAPNIIGAIAAAKRVGAFLLQRDAPHRHHWVPLSRLWDSAQSA
ncbi:MAG: hypothetical protein EA384_05965 [Spirochaetaceae bacterium]|nr:MAG: hypothetical protein EA384_05965 [Spirochaetaceae bacterium]